jgi:proline dehydrogenase
MSAHLSSLPTRDAILYPGCPRTDDLAILKLNGPLPGSPLNTQDLADLRELHEDLIQICTHAQERNVRVALDAEQSWFQVRSAYLLPLRYFYN